MFQSIDERLEYELLRILREHQLPLNLEEIFSYLYDRQDRLSDLAAVTKENFLEKRRVKRTLERSAYQGLLETSWKDGHAYYQATSNAEGMRNPAFSLSIVRDHGSIYFTSQPQRTWAHQRPQDHLLATFCVLAVGVLVAGVIFLIVL